VSALRYRLLDRALAHGLAPAPLLAAGARAGAWLRERREWRGGIAGEQARARALLEQLRSGPIAELAEKANEQHYELPAAFFESFLGPRLKYSACLWEAPANTLAEAEEAMLALTCQRAQIRDGMRILDLGCGWGSLSLWLAERYPEARILAVTNSARQREFVESRRRSLRLANLEVVRANVEELQPAGRFDRVVAVEMLEHMRNWRELLRRISGWLSDDGRLFVHVFSHRTLAYRFERTWAAERFFSGGLMPSHELIARFQEHLLLEESWALPGIHYARTLDAWLERLERNRERALWALASDGRSRAEARAALGRWRLFLIGAREMWGWRGGNRWLVSHYRLRPRPAP
jgi:cyclopropane-fatty-acyl-phospholipid synthase